jgi:hypothetical protein
MVNVFNKAKNAVIKQEEAKPAAPAEDVVLLREIRDELKKGRA